MRQQFPIGFEGPQDFQHAYGGDPGLTGEAGAFLDLYFQRGEADPVMGDVVEQSSGLLPGGGQAVRGCAGGKQHLVGQEIIGDVQAAADHFHQ